MNDKSQFKSPPLVYVVSVVGSLLIVVALVQAMKHYTTPAPLGSERTEVRLKNLQEIKNADIYTLTHFAWQDPAKGMVRLTIDRAMELTIQDYQDAAASRARLIAEAEKAFAPPPEKPSEFE
jgi:hypothetical protein